jgi:O-antigen/teichoic acid export membrane protein
MDRRGKPGDDGLNRPEPRKPHVIVTRNIVANFLGYGWRALVALAFVPLYIRWLGIESYALIGVFTILLASLGVVDTGLRATLGREMARFAGGASDATAVRDVLRTVEVLVLAFGSLGALAIAAASSNLAAWVHSEHLPPQTVTLAFATMGVVIMLAFCEGMYLGCLSGLQQQVIENTITTAVGTVRSLGAVAVIACISPTIEAFFVWQATVSVMSIAVAGTAVYRVLPAGRRPARPSWYVISSQWRFAGGVTALSLVWFLSTQIDKLVLSRALSMSDFGYYTLAASVAGLICMLARPVNAAFWPRLTQLVAQGDETTVREVYHTAAQVVTVLSATAAAMAAAFSHDLLLLWTGDPALSGAVSPLLGILAVGALVQSMAIVPCYMQLAYGWTKLAVVAGLVSVSLMTPALLWAIPRFGTAGAAWSFAALMLIYVVLAVLPMHRRILRGEAARWVLSDVLAPALGAALAASACALVAPRSLEFPASVVVLAVCAAIIFMGAVMSSGRLRGLALGLRVSTMRQLRARLLAQSAAVRGEGI